MKDILVIKHGSLGDIIQALGVMKVIRLRHPEDKITVMTTESYRKLLSMTGFYDDIIIDNRPHYSLSNWYRVCKKILADGKWSVIYDLQLSKRTHRYYLISRFLTRGPVKWAFWQKMKSKPLGFNCYAVSQKSRCSFGKAKKYFEKFDFPLPDLSFCKGNQENFDILPEKYILIMPGCSAGNAYKRWAPEKFADLVRRFENRDIPSVILGTDAEKEEIDFICDNTSRSVNFMNKASVYDIPLLAVRAVAVVGNDTGPTHMASFAGAKTVVLFCERKSFVAVEAPNIVNIIKEDINDIDVGEVYNAVEGFL